MFPEILCVCVVDQGELASGRLKQTLPQSWKLQLNPIEGKKQGSHFLIDYFLFQREKHKELNDKLTGILEGNETG